MANFLEVFIDETCGLCYKRNLPMTLESLLISIFSIPLMIITIVNSVKITMKLCQKSLIRLTHVMIVNYAGTAVNCPARVVIYDHNTVKVQPLRLNVVRASAIGSNVAPPNFLDKQREQKRVRKEREIICHEKSCLKDLFGALFAL